MTMGALEIFLVLFVVLLIIGPRRIAGLGRALGRGIRDFKLELGRGRKDEELPGPEERSREKH
jgi:sec-independent protein translocase protein TatA